MPNQQKVARLLAPPVPLRLEVDGGHALELRLAWTMRGVILLESRLRELGIRVNIVQSPGQLWANLDSATLAYGVWAMSQQEHREYRDEDGFDTIASFIVPENYGTVASALQAAFLESLSEEKRKAIKEAQAEIERQQRAGSEPPAADPTKAPAQP